MIWESFSFQNVYKRGTTIALRKNEKQKFILLQKLWCVRYSRGLLCRQRSPLRQPSSQFNLVKERLVTRLICEHFNICVSSASSPYVTSCNILVVVSFTFTTPQDFVLYLIFFVNQWVRKFRHATLLLVLSGQNYLHISHLHIAINVNEIKSGTYRVIIFFATIAAWHYNKSIT